MSTFSNLGTNFQEGDLLSDSRLNAKSIFSGTGLEIVAIPATLQVPIFRCLETSGGYKKDEVYFRSADQLGSINVRRKHYHSQDTDEEGGTYHNMLINNPLPIEFGKRPFNTLDEFNMSKSGAATLSDIIDGTYGRTINLHSTWSGAVGEYVNATVAGTPIGFGDKVLAVIEMYMAYNANQVARVGFGMEESQNTVDIGRKIGMEMCSGTGTNWQAVTANGITRTTSATSMNAAPVPNTFKTYRMFFNPSNVSYKLTNSDGITKIVTSTIPSGGQIDNPRLFRIGLNTTNATAKDLWSTRLYFVAQCADTLWYSSPE